MNAIGAAVNGIAVGINAGALIYLQREETWPAWMGIVICGFWMVWFCMPRRQPDTTIGG